MNGADIPVLLIVFNRPDKAEKVFRRIRQIKPKQLFIAGDAPRQNKEDDTVKCERTREIVTAVDWECEVHTLFQEANLGCGRGPAAAISWFFSHVESGIILEDDCLPEETFFRFCNELLHRYRDNEQIMMISGTTPVRFRGRKQDYFFSKYGTTWGWASWRRAWLKFDYDLRSWENKGEREKVMSSFKTEREKQYFLNVFEKTFNKTDVSWWDYQWLFARVLHGGLSVMPVSNQIENIGFGKDATHTFDPLSPDANKKTAPLHFPLRHPDVIKTDEAYDSKLLFKEPSFLERIEYRIRKLLLS
jgi:hypothetical protein